MRDDISLYHAHHRFRVDLDDHSLLVIVRIANALSVSIGKLVGD
jgi:hypothetical protein